MHAVSDCSRFAVVMTSTAKLQDPRSRGWIMIAKSNQYDDAFLLSNKFQRRRRPTVWWRWVRHRAQRDRSWTRWWEQWLLKVLWHQHRQYNTVYSHNRNPWQPRLKCRGYDTLGNKDSTGLSRNWKKIFYHSRMRVIIRLVKSTRECGVYADKSSEYIGQVWVMYEVHSSSHRHRILHAGNDANARVSQISTICTLFLSKVHGIFGT